MPIKLLWESLDQRIASLCDYQYTFAGTISAKCHLDHGSCFECSTSKSHLIIKIKKPHPRIFCPAVVSSRMDQSSLHPL